jgi:hypothetical protein
MSRGVVVRLEDVLLAQKVIGGPVSSVLELLEVAVRSP